MYTVKEGKTGVMVAASKYKQGYYKYKDVADKTTKRWNKDSDYENEKVSLKIAQELTDGACGVLRAAFGGRAQFLETLAASLLERNQ